MGKHDQPDPEDPTTKGGPKGDGVAPGGAPGKPDPGKHGKPDADPKKR